MNVVKQCYDPKVKDELHNIYKQFDSLDNTLTNILNIMKLKLAFECGLIGRDDIAKELGIDKDKQDRERLGI